MVDAKEQPQIEIDPFEPTNVKEAIKPLAENEVPLHTRYTQAV